MVAHGLVPGGGAARPTKKKKESSSHAVFFDEDDEEDDEEDSDDMNDHIEKIVTLRIENTKLKEEVHDLRIKAKELEILKETTAKLLKADSEASETAAPKVLTFDEWNAMQKAATKAATPLPSPAKGLFSQFFGKEDEEPQADSVVGALARKLKEADNKQPLRLGASVSQDCEKALQKIAAAVVDEHFPSHKTGKCHDGVQALVVTFSIETGAKLTRTVLVTLLRMIVSRKVDISREDLHLK